VRILHVTTRFLADGGAERNLRHMIEWQRRCGHDVDLAAGAGASTRLFSDGDTVCVIDHLTRPIRVGNDLRALADLMRLIRVGRYDVVHTHESKAGALGRIAARANRRIVVHTVHMPSFGFGYGSVDSRGFQQIERMCARFTDKIVTVGAELRDFYLKSRIGRAEQYMVIHSPVDIDAFAQVREWDSARRREVRQTFGLQPETPVLLAVGALEARKRQRLLIKRIAPLLTSGEVQLVIAGDGPELDRLRSCASELGVGPSVRFLGYVHRLGDMFAAADVFVHASAAEGVSQALIQAVASGVPAVITEATGARELVTPAVAVIDTAGTQLVDVVRRFLSSRPVPLPLERLAPWRQRDVEKRLEQLDLFLESRLPRSRPKQHLSPSCG
jgi:glycosyltransferase involved in cell wall biosynthesis